MKTRRWTALVIALALGSIAANCREAKQDTRPTEKSETTAKSEPQPSMEERHSEALDEANDRLEAARILSMPLDPMPETRVQGVALPLYSELPDLSYIEMLERVAKVGATHVSIVVSWNQQTIHHNKIEPGADDSPSDEDVARVVRAARDLGLEAMIFPIIHVERRGEGEWRGKMAPTKPERWREEYRDYILHYAKLSAEHGVDILCVGSELSSQERDTEFWQTLIADVRKVFDGKLIYSANWDHYEVPKFWSDLDYIGVSSYFEVARRNDEPIFTVTQRWLKHRDELLAFAREQGRPLVLTEVGYPSIDSAAVKPWDYTARTPPNPNAQLAAFRSLTDAWTPPAKDAEEFGGLFIWHGWGHGGPEDVSYPIWGKSTEHLVEAWFSAP